MYRSLGLAEELRYIRRRETRVNKNSIDRPVPSREVPLAEIKVEGERKESTDLRLGSAHVRSDSTEQVIILDHHC